MVAILFVVNLLFELPRFKGTGSKTVGVIGAVRHSGFASLEHATYLVVVLTASELCIYTSYHLTQSFEH